MTTSTLESGLQGCRVLLDTYNLRLEQGSGIKRYASTLLDILPQLGASVALLADRCLPRRSHATLDEVLFHDWQPAEPKGRRSIRCLARSFARTLRHLAGPVTLREVPRELVLSDPSRRSWLKAQQVFNLRNAYAAANHTFKLWSRPTVIQAHQQVDLWHKTTLLPIHVQGARTVTTIHDLIPLRLPHATLDDKRFFYSLTREAIRSSHRIFTVSECTKRDLMAFFDVPEQKILVTYQSSSLADAPRQPERELAVLDCYGLRPQGYLLFVGNIEPKKNLRTLLQAYKSMPFDQPLVVVGRKAWLWEEQLRPLQGLADMSQRIRFLDYVPEADMRALYGQATCLVFPSLYEGFGLPPLEAMALGCPVVCSKVASLPEVCGEAALYVDPLEPESMIQEIERLRKDPELRESLVKAGYRQAEKFSKENYARRLANAYRSVLEE